MPPRVQTRRVRKSPDDRRAEIVAAAAAVALTEGLEIVTLRRIADELGVRNGLISHYFPVVDELVAEAFGTAASIELDTLVPERTDGSPTEHLARFFAQTTGPAFDDISRLWLNARHLARYRAPLRARIGVQEAAWRERLGGLIARGVADGSFRAVDPETVAMQILVVVDGLGASANTGTEGMPPQIARMAVTLAEHELGLPTGTLAP